MCFFDYILSNNSIIIELASNSFGFKTPGNNSAYYLIVLHNFMMVIIFLITIFTFNSIISIIANSSLAYYKGINSFIAGKSFFDINILHSILFETLAIFIPLFILGIIAIPSIFLLYWMSQPEIVTIVVDVTGYQWYWHYDVKGHQPTIANWFTYTKDFEFITSEFQTHFTGRLNREWIIMRIMERFNVPSEYIISFDSYCLPTEDINIKNANNRLTSTTEPLYLPIGINLKFILHSNDVIHNFAVPELGIKLDATPGRATTFTTRIEKEGRYIGQCSELCGAQHGFMPIEIEAVSPKAYEYYAISKNSLYWYECYKFTKQLRDVVDYKSSYHTFCEGCINEYRTPYINQEMWINFLRANIDHFSYNIVKYYFEQYNNCYIYHITELESSAASQSISPKTAYFTNLFPSFLILENQVISPKMKIY